MWMCTDSETQAAPWGLRGQDGAGAAGRPWLPRGTGAPPVWPWYRLKTGPRRAPAVRGGPGGAWWSLETPEEAREPSAEPLIVKV